ncbi:MAG: GNAT family N-acetyltransferase [Verrucomicrobia bacterium]|nr:GNAT family N-acetyltransferase [Verrucomicrobiota bacterium]
MTLDATETASAPALAGIPVRVNPLEHPRWDALVTSHPDYCFFHSRAWASVLQEAYGHAPAYFVVCRNERLGALLGVMEAQSLLGGRRGVSLPFTDFCPLLASEENPGREVLGEAFSHGRRRGWTYLEWRGGPTVAEDARAALAFYGHTLDLRGGLDELSARCDSSVRRAIRKAEREGVRVELSTSLESLRHFYRLYCQTRRKHGLPPQTFRFFETIHRHVLSCDQGLVALAWYRAVPIAGALFCHLGRKAVFKFGASREGFLPLRGNNLVMWEAIKWYVRNGFSVLHFGRTSLANAGLRAFKHGWGTRESLIEYFKYDLRQGTYLTQPDEAYGWHNEVFRRMPLPLARLLGACLYRHWA